MYRKVTPETAPQHLYPGYTYQPLGPDRLLAIPGEEIPLPLQFICPVETVYDRNTRQYLIPGFLPFENEYLCATHPLYHELEIDPFSVYGISLCMGEYSVTAGASTFEPLPPDNPRATALLIVIDYEAEANQPRIAGCGSKFGEKFSAKYFYRYLPQPASGDGLPTISGGDCWVVPRHPLFDEDYVDFAGLIRRRIATIDAVDETYHMTAPIYRAYMEDELLARLQLVDSRYTAEFSADCVDLFMNYSIRREPPTEGSELEFSFGTTQIDRFGYTLDGCQRFIACIMQIEAERTASQAATIAAKKRSATSTPDEAEEDYSTLPPHPPLAGRSIPEAGMTVPADWPTD